MNSSATRPALRRRSVVVIGIALALLAVPFAAPVGIAHACGCGAYSPADGGSARVPQETALVRTTDAGTEDICLSRTRAAAPYTDQGWAFVAVRPRAGHPAAAGTTALDGRLDPLHLHFAGDEIVYPMRLSAMASAPEQVAVFTLAPQRLEMTSRTAGMALAYSQRIDAHRYPGLASVTTGGATYLTRLNGTLSPSGIVDDFHFRAPRRPSRRRAMSSPRRRRRPPTPVRSRVSALPSWPSSASPC